MQRLTMTKTREVSFVPSGANNKRLLVLKEGEAEREAIIEKIKAADKGLMARIARVVKNFGKKNPNEKDPVDSKIEGLSPGAQTAVRAVGRILAPHSEEVTGGHVNAVLDQVGIDTDSGSVDNGTEGEDMKPEHKAEAEKAAKKAYKSAMTKLGYQKYPEQQLTMKESDEDDDEDEVAGKGKGKGKGEDGKVDKAAVSILKEDGTLNLEAVPAELRPFAEVIHKQSAGLAASLAAEKTRADGLEKVMKENLAASRKEQIVAKAAVFKSLKQDDVVKTLELADKAGAEEFDRVLKMFEAQEKQLGESSLFKELGSSQGGGKSPGADFMSQIEKAADGIVEKSAGKVSKEAAIADYIATPEGQKLYAMHQASRPNGI